MFDRVFSSLARSTYSSLFSFSFSAALSSAGTAKSRFSFFFSFFFLLTITSLVVWPRFGDPFVSQNPTEVCLFYFLGLILGCAYTICSEVTVNHLKMARGEIWPKRCEKNNKNYTRWGQKFTIKLILRLRSLISKRIPNKDKTVRTRLWKTR